MPRVLVVGSGGREHALATKLKQDGCEVDMAPGSDGARDVATCHPDVSVNDIPKLVALASDLKPDLTFVGPEAPICAGIGDEFRKADLPIVCPSKRAAQLEGSKAFAKVFMERRGIPTAPWKVFTDAAEALKHAETRPLPMVVKADGLAAGKGVFICRTREAAKEAVYRCMVDQEFGTAGKVIIIEDCLTGRETSFQVFTDGTRILPLPTSQDYKRLFDSDEGPNTGGMGSISPVPWLTDEMQERIMSEVVQPTVAGMFFQGMPFQGVLYFGLMITNDGPKVLEYNVRLGDPETEAILPRIKSSFYDILDAARRCVLDRIQVEFHDKMAACVVLASKGYAEEKEFPTGYQIFGLDLAAKYASIYHAGTRSDGNGGFKTAGGRVLALTSVADTWQMARDRVQEAAHLVQFEGKHQRLDIAS